MHHALPPHPRSTFNSAHLSTAQKHKLRRCQALPPPLPPHPAAPSPSHLPCLHIRDSVCIQMVQYQYQPCTGLSANPKDMTHFPAAPGSTHTLFTHPRSSGTSQTLYNSPDTTCWCSVHTTCPRIVYIQMVRYLYQQCTGMSVHPKYMSHLSSKVRFTEPQSSSSCASPSCHATSSTTLDCNQSSPRHTP